MDNIQCSSKAVEGLFCRSHSKKISEHGQWWLGTVDAARPHSPFGPPSSKKPGLHYWSDQEKPEKTKPSKKKNEEKLEKKEKKEKKEVEEPIESEEEPFIEEKVVDAELHLDQSESTTISTENQTPVIDAPTSIPDGDEDAEDQDQNEDAKSELNNDQYEYGDPDDLPDEFECDSVIEESDDEDTL